MQTRRPPRARTCVPYRKHIRSSNSKASTHPHHSPACAPPPSSNPACHRACRPRSPGRAKPPRLRATQAGGPWEPQPRAAAEAPPRPPPPGDVERTEGGSDVAAPRRQNHGAEPSPRRPRVHVPRCPQHLQSSAIGVRVNRRERVNGRRLSAACSSPGRPAPRAPGDGFVRLPAPHDRREVLDLGRRPISSVVPVADGGDACSTSTAHRRGQRRRHLVFAPVSLFTRKWKACLRLVTASAVGCWMAGGGVAVRCTE